MNFARYCQFLFHGFIPFCTLVPVLYENAYFFQPCSKRLNCQIFVTWHWVVSIVLICISFIMRKIKLLFVGVKSHFFGELILYLLSAAAAKSLQSCPTLCDPKDGSPPGSSVSGILQARTLEWVAISFSNAWKWKVKVKSLSCVRLLATPWTAACQAPPSMGFSRQEYWSGVPYPCKSGNCFSLVCHFLFLVMKFYIFKYKNIYILN